MRNENRDVQTYLKHGKPHPAPTASPRGEGPFYKKSRDPGLQNMDLFTESCAGLSAGQARRFSEYLLTVLSESVGPANWRKMLREARRRVMLYYSEE